MSKRKKKKKKKKAVDTLLQLLWGQMVDNGAVGGRESEKPTPALTNQRQIAVSFKDAVESQCCLGNYQRFALPPSRSPRLQ